MAVLTVKPLSVGQLGVVLGLVMLATPSFAQSVPNPTITTTDKTTNQTSIVHQDYANYNQLANQINQVNNINQFRDVSPQSWSYEALKNLVENYGCIVGYPDGTYRGDRPLTRNEFAAGLSACLNQIEKRILEAKQQFQVNVNDPNTYTGFRASVQPGDSLINVFDRAFYNETGRFYDISSISGQANKIFGWRTFPGSFMDNQITNDGLTFETVYEDALRQQTAGQSIRTTDLVNPFSTSLQQNPGYVRMVSPVPPNSFGYPQ